MASGHQGMTALEKLLAYDNSTIWLDDTMSYSCGYFKTPQDTLHQAQLQKMDHILKKLNLKPNETRLDIGSGWGALILHVTQHYQVKARLALP